jgi:enoyl-CoA hydratase/carnithine racemase
MSDHVVVAVQDRILTVRLNRPEKKNALTFEMYIAMTEALTKADADPGVRVVLITGTPDCFTAGNDLADFAAAKPGQVSPAILYLETLAATSKPVVAAVGGVAIGIGTTMLLHCDLVYATASARFQLPFVNLGLCPEAASSAILPALMGTHRAAELLLFGEPFGPEAARDLGIVNQVVADSDLLATATAKAQQLSQKPPAALRTTKMLLKCGQADVIKQAMSREGQQFAALLQGPEAKEAMAAFLERRKPDFLRF